MARKQSKCAYFYVDLSEMSEDTRSEIIEDATMGGGAEYGVRVVEEVHNGPAQMPIYGVYYGPDEELWKAAQAEFGIEIDPADPSTLVAAASGDAAAQAAAITAAEQAELDKIAPGGNKAKR